LARARKGVWQGNLLKYTVMYIYTVLASTMHEGMREESLAYESARQCWKQEAVLRHSHIAWHTNFTHKENGFSVGSDYKGLQRA
jgi:hypothetical protein